MTGPGAWSRTGRVKINGVKGMNDILPAAVGRWQEIERVAREVFADLGLDHLPSIGVAKGEERKPGLETLFVHGRSLPLQLGMDHAGFHLIQEIRDEAHRFAIVGHRGRRARARGRSKLEDVIGIGPARRKKLLAQFGGLDGVKAATVEDLCRVDGISRRLAEEIHKTLR